MEMVSAVCIVHSQIPVYRAWVWQLAEQKPQCYSTYYLINSWLNFVPRKSFIFKFDARCTCILCGLITLPISPSTGIICSALLHAVFLSTLIFLSTHRSFLQDRTDTSFSQDLGMREQKQERGKGEVNSIKYEIRISLSTFFYSRDECTRKERLYIYVLDYENLKVEK